MVSFPRIKILTMTEFIPATDWAIVAIGLTMFLFRRIWTLALWIRKLVECFKMGLSGLS